MVRNFSTVGEWLELPLQFGLALLLGSMGRFDLGVAI